MLVALLFVVGFLVARILVRVDAHLALLAALTRRTRSSAAGLCLAIMGVTLVSSLVIPNLLTVLAVLPVVATAVDRLQLAAAERRSLITLLGLGVIYAANIGGVGSLLGSPANGLMLAAMAHIDLPERHALTFWRWLAWGLPLALVFVGLAWGVLVATQRKACKVDVSNLTIPPVDRGADYRVAMRAIVVTGLASAAAGIARDALPRTAPHALGLDTADLVLLAGGVVWCVALARVRLPERREPLLRWGDLVGSLPWRGLGFALAAGVVGLILERLGLVGAASDLIRQAIPADASPLALLVALVTATIFVTELFSNTATAIAMWALAAALAGSIAAPAFELVLGVGLASTSAFMSPLATPASGLAFGSLRGLSLRRMLFAGFVLNLLGAALIIAALRSWIPWVLGA